MLIVIDMGIKHYLKSTFCTVYVYVKVLGAMFRCKSLVPSWSDVLAQAGAGQPFPPLTQPPPTLASVSALRHCFQTPIMRSFRGDTINVEIGGDKKGRGARY